MCLSTFSETITSTLSKSVESFVDSRRDSSRVRRFVMDPSSMSTVECIPENVDVLTTDTSVATQKRFEVTKYKAATLWTWDVVFDHCAICRNHIMDLCIECEANQAEAATDGCTAAWGVCNHVSLFFSQGNFVTA